MTTGQLEPAMTLQVTKNSFIHNGQHYPFGAIQFVISQPRHDKAIIAMDESCDYQTVTIQSTHTSALLLCYARWINNRQ